MSCCGPRRFLCVSAARSYRHSADPDCRTVHRGTRTVASTVRGLVPGICGSEFWRVRHHRDPERAIVGWGARRRLDAKGGRLYDRANAFDLRVCEHAACGNQDRLRGRGPAAGADRVSAQDRGSPRRRRRPVSSLGRAICRDELTARAVLAPVLVQRGHVLLQPPGKALPRIGAAPRRDAARPQGCQSKPDRARRGPPADRGAFASG